MTQSSELQNDVDRLKKCVYEIEKQITQLETAKIPDCSQIAHKEKEKFDILLLIEAMEKKLQEVKARENIQPVTDVQKKKLEELILKTKSYGTVRSSYLGFGDN